MITIHDRGTAWRGGALAPESSPAGRGKTMAWGILQKHNVSGDTEALKIKFDAMASHDITYVGIIQTARQSGLREFPLPYVLTNCHNSLCAVGGTINEDDHMYGLSAARKYGGEFVPAHQAVIHQYMREKYAASGRMILASDSHTRYGPYGTLAVGEGGPELVKQLLGRTWDICRPPVVAVYLTGELRPGVGPMDAALALVAATYSSGFAKNKVLEFFGPGVAALSMDTRSGIDVMTTETACLSSVWTTDGATRAELERLGRPGDWVELAPGEGAWYDGAVEIDLSKIEPMIALPFHPSRAYPIRLFAENAADILRGVERDAASQWGLKAAPDLVSKLEGGRLRFGQGVIAGCAGGLAQNIRMAARIIGGRGIGAGAFSLSVYPASQPMYLALGGDGTLSGLMAAGAAVKSAFCGPCFGAGDVPACGSFSARHTTRNFSSREGSKPADGQTAYVALMDARSIAATALRGGLLTAADELEGIPAEPSPDIYFDARPYDARVYRSVGHPAPDTELSMGPNITDWPELPPMPESLTVTVAAALYDPVTTTDELIPSGDTSSYRSNPLKLASFALSRRDPAYVGRCREIGFGSAVVALRPGDGSAREQAASCQRVLGGVANIALEYATKRYRSNLVNWGMLPFVWPELESERPEPGDTFRVEGLRAAVESGAESVRAVWTGGNGSREVTLLLPGLSSGEREILLAGCLANYYAGK